MSLFAVFKKNARLALRGNWGRAVCIQLVVAAVLLVLAGLRQLATYLFVVVPGASNPTMEGSATVAGLLGRIAVITPAQAAISVGFSLLSFLLVSPLLLGRTAWHLGLVHGEPSPVGRLYRYFDTLRDYRRAIWYNIQMSVRVWLWSVAFYLVPGALLTSSVYYFSSRPSVTREAAALSTVGLVLSVLLLCLATLLFILFMNRYLLVPYLLSRGDLPVGQAFRQSIRYTRGFRLSFFLFQVSLLGWRLLGVLCPPVMLYVGPYTGTAYAMYARYIIEKNEQEAAENRTKEFVMDSAADLSAIVGPDTAPGPEDGAAKGGGHDTPPGPPMPSGSGAEPGNAPGAVPENPVPGFGRGVLDNTPPPSEAPQDEG